MARVQFGESKTLPHIYIYIYEKNLALYSKKYSMSLLQATIQPCAASLSALTAMIGHCELPLEKNMSVTN